ncbi:hypothetical protein GSH19_05005 [Lactobacillus sp. S2-2]|uniref:hypothetical protein n=1 Tax=Lactobacillus sp. S2-2 TaxID=2692917 RepID=UPI001F329992|nr:hypothetical protein [Lactobacillus sp. S2-2]
MDHIDRKRRAVLKIIEEHKNIDILIEQRRLEIMYPYKFDKDENVGGGKSDFGNTEVVARQAISVSNDPAIKKLEFHKKTIDRLLNNIDDLTFKIVNDLLLNKKSKSIYDLESELHLTHTTIYKKRNQFIDLAQKYLNLG